MTSQIHESIFYDGHCYTSLDCPLESYENLPGFISASTAEIRGYSAVWSIVADNLYLVHLSGSLPDSNERGVHLVFPTAIAPIFTDWFSGQLRMHRGRVNYRCENEMNSEIEVLLTIRRGHVIMKEETSREYVPTPRSFDPIFFCPLEELLSDELPRELLSPLLAAGIRRIGDLVQIKELDLVRTYGIDLDSAFVFRELLASHGLMFGTYLQDWSK